jgi:hypothetical protein
MGGATDASTMIGIGVDVFAGFSGTGEAEGAAHPASSPATSVATIPDR